MLLFTRREQKGGNGLRESASLIVQADDRPEIILVLIINEPNLLTH